MLRVWYIQRVLWKLSTKSINNREERDHSCYTVLTTDQVIPYVKHSIFIRFFLENKEMNSLSIILCQTAFRIGSYI